MRISTATKLYQLLDTQGMNTAVEPANQALDMAFARLEAVLETRLSYAMCTDTFFRIRVSRNHRHPIPIVFRLTNAFIQADQSVIVDFIPSGTKFIDPVLPGDPTNVSLVNPDDFEIDFTKGTVTIADTFYGGESLRVRYTCGFDENPSARGSLDLPPSYAWMESACLTAATKVMVLHPVSGAIYAGKKALVAVATLAALDDSFRVAAVSTYHRPRASVVWPDSHTITDE